MHESEVETDFDSLMASLFVLVTHHSLTQCDATLPVIVDRINELSHHPEIEFFPHQRKVIAKMQQLWSTRLLKEEIRFKVH